MNSARLHLDGTPVKPLASCGHRRVGSHAAEPRPTYGGDRSASQILSQTMHSRGGRSLWSRVSGTRHHGAKNMSQRRRDKPWARREEGEPSSRRYGKSSADTQWRASVEMVHTATPSSCPLEREQRSMPWRSHPNAKIHSPTPTTHSAENGSSTFHDIYMS